MFDEKDESLHDVAFNLCVCWKSAGVSAADKVVSSQRKQFLCYLKVFVVPHSEPACYFCVKTIYAHL